MKVILVEDVKALGKKGEMVNVSDGYARNMLFPKKLALEASAKNINDLKLKKAHDEKVAKEQLADARAFAEELAKAQVKVSVKVGESGRTPMAKAGLWAVTDAEERKRGERTGLDTLVVHAVNDEC